MLGNSFDTIYYAGRVLGYSTLNSIAAYGYAFIVSESRFVKQLPGVGTSFITLGY